jgi:CDP-diacylglycerol--glycerol-3-phosphate 3-phosphatidyltransferase
MSRSFIPQFVKDGYQNGTERLIDVFVRLKIHPNFFTILGLLIAFLAAIYYAIGDIRLGGLFVLLAGVSDTFDGKLARKRDIASIALSGSVMVSYVRARAEGIGYDCKVGVMQRAERIVFFGVSSLIHPIALIFVIWITAVLANITAIQRLHYVWKTERAELNKESLDETLGI